MPVLPMEELALGLVPFIRQFGDREGNWAKIDKVTAAYNLLCQNVVTTVHFTVFAVWCSTISRAMFDDSPSFFCCAEMWASPKPHPPTVVTFIRTMPLNQIDVLIDQLEDALVLLSDWIFDMSPLLNEDRRIFLRTLNSATMDMLRLIRAAALSKAKGDSTRLSNLLEVWVQISHRFKFILTNRGHVVSILTFSGMRLNAPPLLGGQKSCS